MLKIAPSAPNGCRKVQVGCGPHNILPDWWNVDIRPFHGIDEVVDVTLPWKYKNILNFVYGEHFIEHLDVLGAFNFLRNVRSALVASGYIRLTTPLLEWVLSTHFSFRNGGTDAILGETIAINRAFYGWGHKFIYSRKMLHRLISAAGFIDICFCEYGQSSHFQLSNLERHGGYRIDNGFPSVWIVEAKADPNGQDDTSFVELVSKDFVPHVLAGH
jgi:predicted SAM-dependent methyltransferase